MRLISGRLEASDPTRDRRFITVEAASTAALPPAAARDITRFLTLLMGGVSATLLIACANIAGLLLARGAARRRELETRLALGAGRSDLLMPQRFGSALLSALAGLTTLLVAVGVAGMVGYGVSRRRREIGVRLALGARRGQVTSAMIRGALIPTVAGMLVGLAAALSLGNLVSRFLYGIQPTDVTRLLAASGAMTLVVAVAASVPAWRATGISATAILSGE